MEFSEEDTLYLALCPDPIRFEPVSKVTNIFYDDANQQVFAVRSGGATGVVVKGHKDCLNCSFRMEDKGPVLSIKFSPDLKILSVQRSVHSVEFINFGLVQRESDNLQQEYSQPCKNKNATVLGFIWTASNEILFITKLGLELFQVYPEKRMLKYLKNVSINVDWFLHSPESNILVISSTGGVIQPFQLKPGNIYKFPKLDVDQASPQKCSERDVSIASLYNQTAVLILRHKPKSTTCSGAEIDVYVLNRDKTTPKSHVLKLDTSGRFAINVIDNLIIVHHQASKSSMLFDVRLSGGFDGYATYHQPLVVPMPIAPFRLKLPGVSGVVSAASASSSNGTEPGEIEVELYSANWVVFQPDVIIDARLGCLWSLRLRLQPLKSLLLDKIRLVEFLLQRVGGKRPLLQLIQQTLHTPPLDLPLIASMFDKLNENYRSFLDVEIQSQMSLPVSGKSDKVTAKGIVLVDQQDLYTDVFSSLGGGGSNLLRSVGVDVVAGEEGGSGGVGDAGVVVILTEYIRSLTSQTIPVQHYIYELVLHAMVRTRQFFQLHQFLQYHVVTDSKPLACLLLSLEGVYPAAHQLALDMLKRMNTANDLIVEILLNKQKIIPALRFVQSCERSDHVSGRKFLDAAMRTRDKSVFYAVFKFFEERNTRLRGSPLFDPTDLCADYVDHFKLLFGQTTASPNLIPDP